MDTIVDGDPQGLPVAARAAEARQDWAEAVTAWTQVIELQPDDVEARGKLAVAQQELNLINHCLEVASAMSDGVVVPFLGAGVNGADRPPRVPWERGSAFLPTGGELAEYLAKEGRYPSNSGSLELTRVAQYTAVTAGSGPLYDQLHKLFASPYTPTSFHRLLARIPALLRAKGYVRPRDADAPDPVGGSGQFAPNQLIVTTNYDDLLEQAFDELKEPYDLLTYIADGKHRGKFVHVPSGGTPRLIEQPEKCVISPELRTVILKIHGAVDPTRRDSAGDSYVITEDHYIDYLTRTDLHQLIPARIVAKLKQSRLLFLGYSLRDWNLRVILYRIWQEQPLSYNSWSIQLNPPVVDRVYWDARHVKIIEVGLGMYTTRLEQTLSELPTAGQVS